MEEVYEYIKKGWEIVKDATSEHGKYAATGPVNESWFDNKKSYGDDLKKKDELEGYEPLTGLAELKDEARRIISFLTPGEGDEIEGKYMKEVYPAMALQVAKSLYRKIEKMMYKIINFSVINPL